MNPILKESAKLRGQSKFREAIEYVNEHFDKIPESLEVNAHLEQFYAAQEGRMTGQTKKYARLVAMIAPDVPAIQPYLDGNKGDYT